MTAESLTLEALKAKAKSFAEEVSVAIPKLTFIYAIHRQGQLRNTLHVLEDRILEHPAGSIARAILNRAFAAHEPSGFRGLAVTKTKGWMSVITNTEMLAVVSLNIDQYQGFEEALVDLYRYSWEGIEMAYLSQRQDLAARINNRPMIPKRNALSETRANLASDAFAAMILSTDGYSNSILKLSKQRSIEALSKIPRHKAHNHPFLLAREATEFALEDVYTHLDKNRPRILRCLDIAEEIRFSCDEEQIKKWWIFCDSAQDMAWRGYEEKEILSMALHQCEDPYIRAIAHRIKEATGLTPIGIEHLEDIYNAFGSPESAENLHYELMQETFDSALSQGLEEDSNAPLVAAANTQNRELLQGRFIGWCAGALQAAANAFERAHPSGGSSARAAVLEFEMHRYDADFTSLGRLGNEILSVQRGGEIVTLEDIPDIAKKYSSLEVVISSIHRTLKDSSYQKDIEAVHEFTRTLGPTNSNVTPHLGAHFLISHAPENTRPAQHLVRPAQNLHLGLGQGNTSLKSSTNPTIVHSRNKSFNESFSDAEKGDA